MSRGIPNNIKSLAQYRPDIAAEWNYVKNNEEFGADFNPCTISYGAHKDAWWICERGHEYKAAIYHRTSKNYPRGCPFCRHGRVKIGDNDLKTLRPEIAEQWDYELNIDSYGNILRPEQFSEHNGYRAWWKCKFGHSWQAKIASRTSYNTGCPFCTGKSTSFAEQFIYFYLKQAGLTVKNRVKISELEYDIAIKELNICIEYNSIYHKDKEHIDNRKRDKCRELNIRFIVIEEIYDDLVSINDDYYTYMGITQGKIDDLISIIEDILKDTIYANRVTRENLVDIKRQAFLYSRNIKIKRDESLGYRYPELIGMWNIELNGDITPYDVSAYSSYEAYWNINNKIVTRKIKNVVGNYVKKISKEEK